MKRKVLIIMALVAMTSHAFAASKTWSFASIPSADKTAMDADANWNYNSSKTRYSYLKELSAAPLTANGSELQMTQGLKFTSPGVSSGEGNIRFGYRSSMWASDVTTIIISDVQPGWTLKVTYETSSNGTARTLTINEGATAVSGFVATSSSTTDEAEITASTVKLTPTGGLYIKSISIKDPDDVNPADHEGDFTAGMTYTGTTLKTPGLGNGPVIWCATNGNDATGDGSEANPFYNLQKAVDLAAAGTTIKMKAGTYKYSDRIIIYNSPEQADKSGTADNYITVMCPDGRAVLDFSAQATDDKAQGIRLCASYWHFYKIDICNAGDNGLLIERNKPSGGGYSDTKGLVNDAHDNIIEFCHFWGNKDSGLQIKNLGSFNYIINCDSYWNRDPDDGDADGFAPKVSCGTGNYFYGCRAWENSDDGWDTFYKKDGSFPDGYVTVLENCITYHNGWVVNASADGKSYTGGAWGNGNANGFKMGSEEGKTHFVFNRCLAVCNGSKGFDQNHNSGDMILNNCTGVARTDIMGGKSVKASYSYKINESASKKLLTNCIAINDNYVEGKDITGDKTGSQWGGIDLEGVTFKTSDMKAAPSEFQDVTNWSSVIAPRNEDGSIPQFSFAHLTSNSKYIDAGTAVAEDNTTYSNWAGTGFAAARAVPLPQITYAGTAPDLGAFETVAQDKEVVPGTTTGIGFIESVQNNGGRVKLIQAFNGMVILSLEGGEASEEYTINAFDAAGKTIGQHKFYGTNTSIFLPNIKGIIILKVTGKGVNESIKAIMK